MPILFKEFVTKEFEDAMNKLCEFEHTTVDKLKLARIKKKIADEKEIFVGLIKELNETIRKEFEEAKTDMEKMKINISATEKQQEIEKSASALDVSVEYELASKTKINANNLCALLPILTNVPA